MLWVPLVSVRDPCGVVRVCVCGGGWALGDVPRADAVSLCPQGGLLQAPEDIRVVLGRGEVAGVDSQGVERIDRQFSTDPLRGRWTRPSREGSPRAHFRSSQRCVWVQRCHHCPWAGPKVFQYPAWTGGAESVKEFLVPLSFWPHLGYLPFATDEAVDTLIAGTTCHYFFFMVE